MAPGSVSLHIGCDGVGRASVFAVGLSVVVFVIPSPILVGVPSGDRYGTARITAQVLLSCGMTYGVACAEWEFGRGILVFLVC